MDSEWIKVEADSETSVAHGMQEFLLPAEDVAVHVHGVVLLNANVKGTLLVTNYRLLFASGEPRQLIPLGTIPLATIEKFSGLTSRATCKSEPALLQVVCKDMRILTYAFPPPTKQRKRVFNELTRRAKESNPSDLYAFRCNSSMPRASDPNIRLSEEYLRFLGQGKISDTGSDKWWRISYVNSKYNVCSTYPFQFIVPSSISDGDISQAAAFRARGRFPVITWCHPENGAVMARSSQPLVGPISRKRSEADEKLVAALCNAQRSLGNHTKLIYIADARSKFNAFANGTKGGGSENSSNYSSAKLVYLGLENVHVVKDSFSRLRDYLDKNGVASSDGLSSFERKGGQNWGGGNVSSWVAHTHSILAASSWVAARIALQGASVLVHCSDGWDRTTQVVSLAGLLLDPYYRTFAGFQALIEKDWLAFGHPFADRLGLPPLNTSAANSNPTSSPIFLLWVECVAQILSMYPGAFEFSSAYLVEIVDCVISGRFGNFLCNAEQERELARVADSSGCMWVYLTDLRRSSERNQIHEHYNILYSPDKHRGPLLPPLAGLAPTLWSRFHLRWAAPLESRSGSETEAQRLIELQKEKENADEKLKHMKTSLESLTEILVSEKRARRAAVAVATRGWLENVAIKKALKSSGLNLNFPSSHQNIYTDIASPEDVKNKIMRISQQELSETRDENQENQDQENYFSPEISFSS